MRLYAFCVTIVIHSRRNAAVAEKRRRRLFVFCDVFLAVVVDVVVIVVVVLVVAVEEMIRSEIRRRMFVTGEVWFSSVETEKRSFFSLEVFRRLRRYTFRRDYKSSLLSVSLPSRPVFVFRVYTLTSSTGARTHTNPENSGEKPRRRRELRARTRRALTIRRRSTTPLAPSGTLARRIKRRKFHHCACCALLLGTRLISTNDGDDETQGTNSPVTLFCACVRYLFGFENSLEFFQKFSVSVGPASVNSERVNYYYFRRN